MEPDSSLLSEYPDPPKGTLKTIVDEDGQVIDFVDIYQQPALQNPLLKDHELQLAPSHPEFPLPKEEGSSRDNTKPLWKDVQPPGTVPIQRRSKKQIEASSQLSKGLAPVWLSEASSWSPPSPKAPPVEPSNATEKGGE